MRNRIVTAVKQRFSIRKLSIGAASVLLGTSLYFMGGSATIVHADTPQTVSGQTGKESGQTGDESGQTGVQNPVDPVEVANEKNKDGTIKNDDTTVNQAIDKYAQDKQEKVGNILIRASGKEPTTPANTADERAHQVNSIVKNLDTEVNNANSVQEQTDISNYIKARKREGFSNITDGKEANDFADQGLSVDDEKDSEINQISVDHKPITLLKGQSENIDGIDVTHTNQMTEKEKNDMKINSDNKVIIDFQHDQWKDKEITVTYNNLNNSYYLENIDNKTNKIKISKIERTFSDIQPGKTIFTSDGKTPKGADGVYDKCDGPQLIIYNDPSDGFFYNNITQVSVKDIYYDDNGNKIFNTENDKNKPHDKNKAWIFVTSLNSNGGGNVEKVSAQIKNSPANASPANVEKIAGSTVTNHNGWWYSDKNNWFNKNPDWDSKDEDNRYGFVGTVAVQYQPGMTLQYRADDSQWGSHWACTQTQVVSTLNQRVIIYDHIKDNVVPKEVTTKWNETIHYVIADDSSKAPKAPEDHIQYSNWGKTETIDQITGNTVEDGEYDTDWKLQPGEKKYYGEVPNERIDGYHTKDKSVAETPVIPGYIEKTVVYYPNGKIIPVDKNGNQIPGADQPVFPTDPSDPTNTVNGKIPDVKGYHPEQGKPGDTVFPKQGKPGEDVSVVYVEDDQIAQVIYRDVNNTDKTKWVNIDTSGDITGKAGSEINYDPQSHIDQFINKGYELKNNGFPAGAVFDNDSNKTQTFYIDFIHGTTTVTPDKPGEPGEPINPKDPNGPKWPDGTGKDSLTKTIKQTVHYVYADKTTPAANDSVQSVAFKHTLVFDNVTGKQIKDLGWDYDNHTFKEVVSPDITGYTPNLKMVESRVVTPSDSSKELTVIYTKVADQLAQIIYRDDDDNDKVLATDDSSGKAGSEINYDPQSHIDQFINKGYELKNNGFPAGAVFDNDSNKTQTFYIDFIHGTTTVTPDKPGEPGEPINPKDPNGPKWPDGTGKDSLTKTIKQTVHYVYADKTTPAANDSVQSVAFKHTLVFDNVTGKQIKDLGWDYDNHTFKEVVSPDITGYTPNLKMVESRVVTPSDSSKELTVIYTKVADQLAQIIYRDDDDNDKVLATDDSSGKAGSEINYDPQSHIDQFINKGYELKNNGFPAGAVFDNDSNKTQTFYIDFIHGTTTVTPDKPGEPGEPINPKDPNGPKWPDGTGKDSLTKTIKQTVHYVYADKTTPAANDSVQSVAFKHTLVFDNVTGKQIKDLGWDYDNHTFKEVVSPDITGYTPNLKMVESRVVTPSDSSKELTVIYTKVADQLAQIIYRDDDDNDKVLATDDSSGKAGSEINYDPQSHIDQFINKGYELKNNGFPAGAVFDNDSNKTQTFYIDFIHGTTTVTPDKPGEPGEPINPKDPNGPKWPDGTGKDSLTKTIKQTVHYVYADKTTPAANDSVQSVAFKHTLVFDNVTGKQIKDLGWDYDNHTFKEVVSPDITGYTPNLKMVESRVVTPSDSSKELTVIYTKVADQLAQIIYRDDDDNDKVLATDDSSGKAGSEINYDPQSHIDQFINKGYELKNNGFPAGAVFDNDSNKTQTFYIDFIHGTTTVTPDKPGEPGEPINPKDPNGPKWPDGTGKDSLTKTIKQTVHYVYADKTTPAANDSVQSVAFKHTLVFDNVTGKQIKDLGWDYDNHTFKEVVSPDITGYTPNLKMVESRVVTPSDSSKELTVIYTKVADQLAQIIYRDDDDNDKVLATDDSSGKAGSEINYDPQSHIDQFINKGYELKNNGFPAGAVFDNDSNKTQTFYIDFIHGTTTVTPDKPGEPGEPINPKDPNGPKWPDGTDKAGLTKTGTQTIQYVGAGDKTPAANTQQYTFSKSMVIDKVTGKVLDQGSWNIDSHTFGTVNTPVIPGYQADKAVAGGETVTPDDLNKVVTVTYAPEPVPEPTPTPEPVPEPTPTPEPVPEPTPTPEPVPKPTPTPEPVPEPTPTPEPVPEPTPTPEPVPEPTPSPDDQPDTTLPSDKTRITKQEHIGNAEKAEPLAEQEHNDQTVASPVKNEANEPQLPQTGEANTSVIGLLGMLVTGFAAILGFESSRSRKHKN